MKKLVFGLAAVMMCVSLAGCGGKAVDINELASALSSGGTAYGGFIGYC